MAKKKRKTSEGGYNTFRNRLGHYIVGVILVIAGPVFSIYYVRGVLDGRASENWPTVKAKVVDAKLVETQDIRGTHFETKVRYTFEVDGKKYNGDRLKIGGKSTSNEKDAEADLKRYGERAAFVDVRYDPSDPNRSTVETGATTGNYILVAGVGPAILVFGFLLIGIGGLMSLLARNRESDDEENADEDEDEEEDRPKSKKPKRKPAKEEEETRPRKVKRRPVEDENEDEEEPPRKRKRQ
jgi:Protein of unknown function (DUF3592)